MTTITHPYTLQLQTVVDGSNPTGGRLLALNPQFQQELLTQMVKDLLLKEVEKVIAKLNENSGGWARLEVVA